MDICQPLAKSSCIQSAAGNAKSTSQSANVSRCVKINKIQLQKINEKGETLLHKACKREDLEWVKALIQAGVNVNMKDYAGWTALHEASSVGNEAVVAELLKAGANVNSRSFDGVTPLHDAVSSGHYQVVKLLLQYGSNVSNRNGASLSPQEMAEDEKIKQLLLTFHPSSVRRPEAHCYIQLSCQSNSICSDTANMQYKESDDTHEARERSDTQQGKKDTTTLSHSKAVTSLLDEVGRNQTEMLTWPLSEPQDAGRYHAALRQIQCVLTDVLAKQHLVKANLAQGIWSVSNFFSQHGLKMQLASLASRQKSLMKVLQKQMKLVHVYVIFQSRLFTQSTNHQVVRQPQYNFSTGTSTLVSSKEEEGAQKSFYRESQRNQSYTPVKWLSLLRLVLPNNATNLKVPTSLAPLISQRKKTVTHTNMLEKEVSCQSGTPQSGNTMEHNNLQSKIRNPLTQAQDEEKSRHHSKLIQKGVLPFGSALQLLLKVTFMHKPLCYYLLTMESNRNTQRRYHDDNSQDCRADKPLTTVSVKAASLTPLMKIEVISVVGDAELLPKAILDCCWEKLLKKKSEEWSGLL